MPENINGLALFLPELKELLIEKNYPELKKVLREINLVDLATGWDSFTQEAKFILYSLLDARRQIQIFEELDLTNQQYLLSIIQSETLPPEINEQFNKLFRRLPPKTIKKLANFVKKESTDNIHRQANYKKGTAGTLINPEFITLKKEMTAKQAVERLQISARLSKKFSNFHVLYVTDKEERLTGAVSLRRLISAPIDIPISEIMTPVQMIKISTELPAEEVSQHFIKYDLIIAPVVDFDNHLVGTIAVDDIVDIIKREDTKDFYQIGKMAHSEGVEIKYASVNAFELVKRRVGWLFALLALNFFSGAILKNFQVSLETVVALAFFIPMLLDTGGNAGQQTTITIIRGLATGDVTLKNIWQITKMELYAALLMGLCVGIFGFARVVSTEHQWALAFVVGLTLLVIVILAIATGVALPILSKIVGLDPAVVAGPAITTIVDVGGLIIYFQLAKLFLPQLR